MGEVSVPRLAELFGCLHNSYAQTITDSRTLIALGTANPFQPLQCFQLAFLPQSVHQTYHNLEDTTDMLFKLLDLPAEELNEIMSEFCHLYLPTFINAFRAAFVHGSRSSVPVWTDDHVFMVLSALRMQPDLSRYVRDHQGGLSLLMDAMQFLRLWVQSFIGRLEANQPWVSKKYYHGFIPRAFDAVKALVFVASTPSSFTSDLQSPVATALLQDLDSLGNLLEQKIPLADAETEDKMNRVLQDLGNLQIVLRGCYEHEECSRYRDEFRASLCWWNCEGRGLGKCRKLKKGAEMMACGRCKAVRYCSPEHQKAHWKFHKKTCRTPIW